MNKGVVVPTAATVDDEIQPIGVEVFRGSEAASLEFALVLDAKGLGYQRILTNSEWTLQVAPAMTDIALDELNRYADERSRRQDVPLTYALFAGSGIGAAVYALVLIGVAYCAGLPLYGVDWLGAGALEAGGSAPWWRAVTALTLHVDQAHLLGNLLFGAGIGVLAGRMFGPGVAWLGILFAGAAANYVDMVIAPSGHRAVGASTAVFAALGLLAGFGWGRRLDLSYRRLYRWGPLFAGVCLLALLGAGDEHVDVLGHVLGFLAGIAMGWGFARAQVPRSRAAGRQWVCGMLALSVVAGAWLVALQHARA